MRGPGGRIWAIARKEFLHIIYDYRTLFIVFLMPTVQLIMFGYALNLEIQRVDLGVVDFARSTESRHLVQQFAGSPFFRVVYQDGPLSRVKELFKSRRVRAVLVIPADFDRRLLRQSSVPVQFLIDASDANAGTLIRNYCNQVVLAFNERRGAGVPLPFDLRSTVLFNPDLKSSFFFVPGIVALVLVMISALLTSIAIAREEEMGTMEQILVSPVRPYEIIVGKVLPYIGLACLDAVLILLIGIVLFGVPFRGSPPLLLLLTALYIVTALSLGLLISTVAQSQQVAMMMALTATLLPTIVLSGLVFPIASMPRLLQYITYLVPARYYLLIVRGVMLKSSSLGELLAPTLSLLVMTVLLLVASVRRFSTTLER